MDNNKLLELEEVLIEADKNIPFVNERYGDYFYKLAVAIFKKNMK